MPRGYVHPSAPNADKDCWPLGEMCCHLWSCKMHAPLSADLAASGWPVSDPVARDAKVRAGWERAILEVGNVRRVAKFIVTPEALQRLMSPGRPKVGPDGKVKVLTGGFPQDMEVIHCEWDFATQSAVFTARSKEFHEVTEGSLTPWLEQQPSFTEESWPPNVDYHRTDKMDIRCPGCNQSPGTHHAINC